MFLRHTADRLTFFYMVFITSIFIFQWNALAFYPGLWLLSMVMAISVAVMAHNHNHVPIWKQSLLNRFTDYWLTLFYGYPVCAWIPTHNQNHHFYNNRPQDYTITYRFSEANNLLTLLTYPTISGMVQQKANFLFLRKTWIQNKPLFLYYFSQYFFLIAITAGLLCLDWKKTFLYLIFPQQFSLFCVLSFNYIQHVHADEESTWNHSRNFTGKFLNRFLFNNGFHTVHHMYPLKHWSDYKTEHEKIAHHITKELSEKSFWHYMIRNYILGLFVKRFQTQSLRTSHSTNWQPQSS